MLEWARLRLHPQIHSGANVAPEWFCALETSAHQPFDPLCGEQAVEEMCNGGGKVLNDSGEKECGTGGFPGVQAGDIERH
jgi:hypothetical protein